MGKPQMSDDDSLLSEVGDCKACFLCVLAIPEYDLNFLHDGSVLIWGSIYVVILGAQLFVTQELTKSSQAYS